MDLQKVIDFWIEEAEESLQVAYHLFEKRDYSYALFFGHLAIEKILKAVHVARKGEHAPYLHNLEKLAVLSDIALTAEQKMLLIQITNFNLEARYPDQKRSFRKKCTEEFTQRMLNKIDEVFQWLKSML